ncbi:MAG: hypothetical protein NTV61_10620 [Candidatus Bathyarchaeota archaeon]|nr:hypothetical protein [Candidatus Bathyarchaeota archaeon]
MSWLFKGGNEKKEDKNEAEIRKLTDQYYDDFQKSVGKELGKMGYSDLTFKSLGYPGLVTPSFIIVKLKDTSSQTLSLIQTLQVYIGSPSGTMVTLRKVYPSVSAIVATIPGTIPYTLVHREVSKGFLKGSEKLFVPFTNTTLGEPKLVPQQLMESPLVSGLNKLVEAQNTLYNNLLLTSSVHLTYKADLNISCSDLGGRCTVVPMGKETAFFFRGAKGDIETYFNFGKLMPAISQVIEMVSGHLENKEVTGVIPSPSLNIFYSLAKTGQLPSVPIQ